MNLYEKRIFLAILLLLFINDMFPQQVSINEAETVAQRVMSLENFSNSTIDTIFVLTDNYDTIMYDVHFNRGGFVLISGNKFCMPILGFSHTNEYEDGQIINSFETTEGIPEGYMELLNLYANQIKSCFRYGSSDSTYFFLWTRLLNNQYTNKEKKVEVSPLITTKWGQNSTNDKISGHRDNHAYNFHVANQNSNCIGGYCPAGCVAIAMAQIMKKWNFPAEIPSNCSMYDWTNMPDKLLYHNNENYTTERDAISKLIFDCAESVNMVYCSQNACSSGVQLDSIYKVIDFLKHKCAYNSEITLKYRSNYTYNAWEQMLISNLNYGMPLFYSGIGSGGHAFVCDGYKLIFGEYKFNFNWGWKGKKDGYYALNDLTPGSSNYNFYQAAIFNIYPTSCYEDIIMECDKNFASGTNKTFTMNSTFSNNNHDYTISQGSSIHLQAGKDILLTDGFYAAEGSDFEAIIAPCSSSQNLAHNDNSGADMAQNIKSLQKQKSYENEIKLFPNPTTGELNIELSNPEETVTQIEILSITGNVVMRLKNVNSGINVSSLPAGLYVARVTTSNGNVYYSKLIKN